MSEMEHDLRATAEDIAAEAADLASIEVEKTRLDVHDPRVADLSAESERIARRLVPKTTAERELVTEITSSDGGGSGGDRH